MSAPRLHTTATTATTTIGTNVHPSFATLHALHALLGTSLAALQQSYLAASVNLSAKPSSSSIEEDHNEEISLPSLSSPYKPGASEDHLARDPDARRAVLRIVAACEQMVACVRTPMETLSDVAMFFQLPACLAVLENAHIVEILRDAGVAGMHVNDIAAKVPTTVDGKHGTIDPMVLARILRCLATNHILTEVSPDVFATNRISSFMDTGKSVDDILRDPCAKYDSTNGVAAYVGMTTHEVFRSSAYLSESLGLGPRTGASPPPSPTFSQTRSKTVRQSVLGISSDTATSTMTAAINLGDSLSLTTGTFAPPAGAPGATQLMEDNQVKACIEHQLEEQPQDVVCLQPDAVYPTPSPSPITSSHPSSTATRTRENNSNSDDALNGVLVPLDTASASVSAPDPDPLAHDPVKNSYPGVAISGLVNGGAPASTESKSQTQTRTESQMIVVSSLNGTPAPAFPPTSMPLSSPHPINPNLIPAQQQQIYTWKPHVHSRSLRPSSKVKLGGGGGGGGVAAATGYSIHNVNGATRTVNVDGRNGGVGDGGLTPKTATRTTRSLPSPLLPPADSFGVVPSGGNPAQDHDSAARDIHTDALTGHVLDTHADVPRTAFSLAFRTRLPFFAFLEAQGGGGVGLASMSAAERAGNSVSASGTACIPGVHENANANDNFLVRRFGAAMRGTSQAGWEVGGVVGGFDWASLRATATASANGNVENEKNTLVIDVGGGIGSACLALAEAYPHLRFVVQDRGRVVRVAREVWEEAKPEWVRDGRVVFEEHDFFLPQPPRPSGPPAAYILRAIAHDWPDKQVLRILRRLRDNAGKGTALVLADHVIPYACVGGKSGDGESEGAGEALPGAFTRLTEEGVEDVLLPNLGRGCINAYWMDMTMHEVFESQERTITHTVALAREAGWRAVRVNRIESSLFAYVICYPDSPS